MDRKKLNRIITLVLTALILVVALVLIGGMNRPARIVLPIETEDPEQSTEVPGETSGALIQVAITPETVQTAIETLSRPDRYRRTLSIQQLWSSGSGSWETTVSVDGAWTRTDRTLVDGRLRHVLTDGSTTYIWHNQEQEPFLSLGFVSPDAEQHIPTYEDVLFLSPKEILIADYRTIADEIPCIYVETDADEAGHALRYWVSVETGLLTAAEKLLEGETIYRMWETAIDLSPTFQTEFTLPDGTVLTA